MNTLNKYFLVFSALVLFSCSKDIIEPLPEENSPVFKLTGQIDGKTILLNAGENEVFMKTSTTLMNNVKQFNGSLENSQTSFSISLTDGMLDIPSLNPDIENFESFNIAPYTYGEPLAIYSIEDFPNSEYIEDIEWSIDGEIQTGNTLKIYKPGNFDVCARVRYFNDSKGFSCNKVLIGYQKNTYSVLHHMVTDNYNVIAFLDSPDQIVSKIDWLINDSIIYTSSSDNFKINFSGTDSYRLGAHVTFENGTYREKELFVNLEDMNNYIGDFSVMENQSTANWDHSATVIIRHNQKEYRAIQDELNSATISIDDVVSYNKNSSGDQVSIFKGTLNCSFIDLATEEIVDGKFEFSLGIAH